MKRFLLFIGFVIALALIAINLKYITPAHASQENRVDVYQEKKLVRSVVFAIRLNRYYVDNKSEGVLMDAKPFIQDGRTFVPIRYLSNALGVEDGNIYWNQDRKQVILMAWNYVEMTVDNPAIAVKVPGAEQANLKIIDVSPILKESEGRTYLPARYVAEALGYDVDWDENTQTVLCWPRGEARPDVSAVKQKAVEERARLEGKTPQETEKKPEVPPGYKVTSMGYVVPENTKMLIIDRKVTGDPEKDRQIGVNLTLGVLIPSSEYAKKRLPSDRWITEKEFETELQQAEDILANKHGREIAKAVVDYARQKTLDTQTLEKDFSLSTGGRIRVESAYSTPVITIDVWR